MGKGFVRAHLCAVSQRESRHYTYPSGNVAAYAPLRGVDGSISALGLCHACTTHADRQGTPMDAPVQVRKKRVSS